MAHDNPEDPKNQGHNKEHDEADLTDAEAFLTEDAPAPDQFTPDTSANLANRSTTEPVAQSENTVDHGAFDKRLYGEIFEASDELSNLPGHQAAPETMPELLEDFFYAFFKVKPKLLDSESLAEEHARVNLPFVERLLEDERTALLRVSTCMDDMASALGALEAGQSTIEEIENRPDLANWITPPPDDNQEQDPEETDAEDNTPAQEPPQRDMRRLMRQSLEAAQQAVDDYAEALGGWGLSPGDLQKVPLSERLEIARRLRSPKMAGFASLLGRMRDAATSAAATGLTSGTDDVHSITTGGPIHRVLPQELAAGLGGDSTLETNFYRKMTEGSLLSYELTSPEAKQRGPIVAMVDSCLTGETKVIGPNGAKRMDELKPGDLVYSYDKTKLTTNTLKKAWFTKRQEVFKVRTSNRTLLASPNHPFLRLRRVKNTALRDQNGRFAPDEWISEWARTDTLRRGDRVVTLRHTPDTGTQQQLSDGTPITEDIAWLLGLIAGDGWISHSGVAICVYGETREKAANVCKSVWNANNSRSQQHGIRIHSVRLRDALRNLGTLTKPSHLKRIPQIIWLLPHTHKRAFLDGYAAADGHEGQYVRTYASTSQNLISETRIMHIVLGDRVSNLHLTSDQPPTTIRGKVVTNRRPYWRFKVAHNQSRGLDDGHTPKALKHFETGPFAYQQVLDVQSVGEQDTYDLEIEGSHNFIAEGIVVHNSPSMSGSPMDWAAALAAALAQGPAAKEGRPVHLLYFNTQVVKEVELTPHEKDPKKLLDIATVGTSGGTDFDAPINRAVEIVGINTEDSASSSETSATAFEDADLILVTDGQCRLSAKGISLLTEAKSKTNLSLYAVLCGPDASAADVERYATEVYSAEHDLAGNTSGDEIATDIFRRF